MSMWVRPNIVSTFLLVAPCTGKACSPGWDRVLWAPTVGVSGLIARGICGLSSFSNSVKALGQRRICGIAVGLDSRGYSS